MKQKTAMMELIEKFEENKTIDYMVQIMILKAESKRLLEKEKEQIMKSMGDAVSKADMTNNRGFLDCEKLFNETYKQD